MFDTYMIGLEAKVCHLWAQSSGHSKLIMAIGTAQRTWVA